MNKQEVDIFFALLRNALLGQPINHESWSKKWSWRPILDVIDFHVLQTLMAEPILSLPNDLRPSESIQSEYMQMVAMNMADHIRLNNDVVESFRLLTENGFHPILLKGQGNAFFYPKPLLRKIGDIDLLIGEEQYDNACCFLQRKLNAKIGKETGKHLTLYKGETEFEIHKYVDHLFFPQKNSAYQNIAFNHLSLCDSILINDKEIQIPPKQFLPLFLFNHLWTHFKYGSVGFRQYADLAVVLHQISKDVDSVRLENDLKDCGLLLEWKCVGPLLVHLMGLPANEFPLYEDMGEKKARAFADLVFLDGNFNYKKNYNGRVSHLWCSVKKFTKRSYLLSKVSYPLALRVFMGAFVRGVKNIFQKGKDW